MILTAYNKVLSDGDKPIRNSSTLYPGLCPLLEATYRAGEFIWEKQFLQDLLHNQKSLLASSAYVVHNFYRLFERLANQLDVYA